MVIGKFWNRILLEKGIGINKDELRKPQIYIGKRNESQTDEQVIKHIDEVNTSTPLTDNEWHELLYPCCNSGCVNVLKHVLNKIKSLIILKTLWVMPSMEEMKELQKKKSVF